MRIAVAYEKEEVFQRFGHTERFKVYDIRDGEVVLATVVNTNGTNRGALADILRKIEVDTLICGGIGNGAQRALGEVGITVYSGVQGRTDDAVAALLSGTLESAPATPKDHQGSHRDEARGCSAPKDGCDGEVLP